METKPRTIVFLLFGPKPGIKPCWGWRLPRRRGSKLVVAPAPPLAGGETQFFLRGGRRCGPSQQRTAAPSHVHLSHIRQTARI